MGRTGAWVVGLVVSGVAHLGFGAALMAALQPPQIVDQPRAESRLEVTPEVVTRSDAAQQDPQSTDVTGTETTGAAMGADTITTSKAERQSIPQTKSDAVSASEATVPSTLKADAVVAQIAAAQASAAAVPKLMRQRPATPTAAAVSSATPTISAAKPIATPRANFQPALDPTPTAATAVALQSASTAPLPPPTAQAQAALNPGAAPAVSVAPKTTRAAVEPPPSRAATTRQPAPVALPSSAPNMTATKAVLAFPDAASGVVDPASLAAFQSFTQPQGAGADTVRDNLQSLLSLPCARMQVSFDPVNTTLLLTGHVPQEGQRAPVLAALQAQMGGDITVTDNLLVLPAPQCGALSGIAAVGLPQSTDQITNPLIVGDDTHARSFRYIKDDPLVLNLTAPDYPAYVYVDYFDADGNVIHLSPNTQTPLVATSPKEQLQIGARAAGERGLMVIIGPPYGQEIAVAFAASAPLYQEERPLVEPADAYLAWLQEQVTQARARDSGFKGEWVYFFVQTAAD